MFYRCKYWNTSFFAPLRHEFKVGDILSPTVNTEAYRDLSWFRLWLNGSSCKVVCVTKHRLYEGVWRYIFEFEKGKIKILTEDEGFKQI